MRERGTGGIIPPPSKAGYRCRSRSRHTGLRRRPTRVRSETRRIRGHGGREPGLTDTPRIASSRAIESSCGTTIPAPVPNSSMACGKAVAMMGRPAATVSTRTPMWVGYASRRARPPPLRRATALSARADPGSSRRTSRDPRCHFAMTGAPHLSVPFAFSGTHLRMCAPGNDIAHVGSDVLQVRHRIDVRARCLCRGRADPT